jgi:flagellar biosynthesis anti-sigma factor FlgM
MKIKDYEINFKNTNFLDKKIEIKEDIQSKDIFISKKDNNDQVSISSAGLKKLEEEKKYHFDKEKVLEIKNKIENGSYSINYNNLAKKILDNDI